MAAECILVTDSISLENVSANTNIQNITNTKAVLMHACSFPCFQWFSGFLCSGPVEELDRLWEGLGLRKGSFPATQKLIPPHWLGHHISLLMQAHFTSSHPHFTSPESWLRPVFKRDPNVRQTRYFVPRIQPWTGKMAQLVKHLPH